MQYVVLLTQVDRYLGQSEDVYLYYFSVQNYDISLIAVLGAHAAFVGSTPQKSKYLYGLCLHCGRKRQVSLLQMREIS